jgi:hypothetical protein
MKNISSFSIMVTFLFITAATAEDMKVSTLYVPSQVPSGNYQTFDYWQQVYLGATALVKPDAAQSIPVVYMYDPQTIFEDASKSPSCFQNLTKGAASFAVAGVDGLKTGDAKYNWTVHKSSSDDFARGVIEALKTLEEFNTSAGKNEPSGGNRLSGENDWEIITRRAVKAGAPVYELKDGAPIKIASRYPSLCDTQGKDMFISWGAEIQEKK